MSDVFLSYSRTDHAIASQLAAGLEKKNLTVWWDPKILPGSDYRDILKKQLELAACVVVLWSSNSVASHMVREEAHYGQEKGKLIPVLVEKAEIPLGFTSIEAADLSRVGNFDSHPEFINLLTAIKAKIPSTSTYRLPKNIFDPSKTFGTGLTGISGIFHKPKAIGLASFTELQKSKTEAGVVFEDDFSDNARGWLEKRDHQKIVMRIKNGKYSINYKQDDGGWYTWLAIPLSKTVDFEIEVEIAHLFSVAKYDTGKMPYYGVNWGGSGGSALHEIQFSYDGYFSYKQVLDDEWIDIIPWKKTYSFNELDDSDIRVVNKIQIIRKSNIVEFWLNDSWLEDADFDPLYGDNIGFSIHRNLEIEVNHIKVSQK